MSMKTFAAHLVEIPVGVETTLQFGAGQIHSAVARDLLQLLSVQGDHSSVGSSAGNGLSQRGFPGSDGEHTAAGHGLERVAGARVGRRQIHQSSSPSGS